MIEDLESTEVGVDGVPSMNIEEDKDNDRKLKEERLIESMEDQLYKVRSVSSSPCKQQSPAEVKKSSIPSPLSSPSKQNNKRERDEEIKKRVSLSVASSSLANIRRRSESLPPQLKKGLDGKDEPPFNKMPYNSYSSQISDPSGMYSNELPNMKPELRSSVELFRVPSFGKDDNKSYEGEIMGGIKRDQPYSSSLENLDPSAKEFLVDAGIILNNVSPSNTIAKTDDHSMLPSATSLPNISKIDNYKSQSHMNLSLNRNLGASKIENNGVNVSENVNAQGSAFSSNTKIDGQQEGDLSKYLISNEEMKRYEAEYQKASIALKAADAMSLQSLASILNDNSLQTTSQKMAVDNPPRDMKLMQQNSSNGFGTVSQLTQNSIRNNEEHVQNIVVANSLNPSIDKYDNNVSVARESNAINRTAELRDGSTTPSESNNVFDQTLQYIERNLNGGQSQDPQPAAHANAKQNAETTENKMPDMSINDSVVEAQNMLTNFAATFTTNKIQDSIEKFAEKANCMQKQYSKYKVQDKYPVSSFIYLRS